MQLHNFDCYKVLKKMKSNSVDSIVCDPPYGIGILKKKWDQSMPSQKIWKECFRVLKPGGHILVFSSARLYHRLAVLMENVGFDTFNMLSWVYGSGIPKGRCLSSSFDETEFIPKPDDKFRQYLRGAIKKSGYKIIELERMCGTNNYFSHYLGKSQPVYPSLKVWKKLKIILALDDSYDEFFKILESKRDKHRARKKVKSHSNYSLFDNQGGAAKKVFKTSDAIKWDGWRYGKQSVKPVFEPIYFGQKPPVRPVKSNIKKWGIGALNIAETSFLNGENKLRRLSSMMIDGDLESTSRNDESIKSKLSYFNHGSELQFFPKPSVGERLHNNHPTLKPISLMRALVRLVNPRGSLCLDPFMGSGTTGEACVYEGVSFIGIEKNLDYFLMAKNRLVDSKASIAS